jgi:Rix1 complex component involved in 60S ribosome maturation
MLSTVQHYSEKTRRATLQNLCAFLLRHPSLVQRHFAKIVAAISPCATDSDAPVREASMRLWDEALFATVSDAQLSPFVPTIMAQIFSAATSLDVGVCMHALQLLDSLVAKCPAAVMLHHGPAALQLFANLLSAVRAVLLHPTETVKCCLADIWMGLQPYLDKVLLAP